MKINSIKWGAVVFGGWFFILSAAAIFLSPPDSKWANRAGPVLSTSTLIWLILTAISVVLYFYRSWRCVPLVQNRRTYTAWLAFETVGAFVLAGSLAWFGYTTNVCHTSSLIMREHQLRYDLTILRAILNQYPVDNRKRPQSLHELVERGYLKEIPSDPLTGRRDSWILEWSSDSNQPGIANVRSSSNSKSIEGTRYREW